jgi:hypothetical protein
VSRDVARARECALVPKCTRLVPAKTRNLAIPGNIQCPLAGLLDKPSDGREPSTPSPYHGGFALRLCDAGNALNSRLSLQVG